MSQAKIAEAVGLTPGGVALILHRHGIRSRSYGGLGGNRYYRPSTETLQMMIEMYSDGYSCEDIAKKVNIPWITVNRLLKEQGVELRPGGFQEGDKHHGWRGGRIEQGDGYLLVLMRENDPLYCMAQSKVGKLKYALEHRIVMARHLGRPLQKNETVHHIDGNKQNNDLSNLQLRRGKHGKGSALVCRCCGSRDIIERPLADADN